jgi:uncharacterized protein YdaU (DUF1376 family)
MKKPGTEAGVIVNFDGSVGAPRDVTDTAEPQATKRAKRPHRMQYFAFDPVRYRAETRRLRTLAGRGAWIELIAHQWDTGSLPADHQELGEIAGARNVAEWRSVWPRIEPLFPIDQDGHRRAPWLEQERAYSLAAHAERVASGSKGGAATAGKGRSPQ